MNLGMHRHHLECWDIRDSPVSSANFPVSASNNAEEAMFAPVGSPTVAGDPVVHAIFSAPSVQLDGVIGCARVAGVVLDDASGVHRLLQTDGIDVCGHRASGEDLGHDIFIASDTAVFGEGDHWVGSLLHGDAASCWVAVHASIHGCAGHVLCLILLAGDVWNAILVHPSVGGVGIATVA